ncbi:unnamed protein product [Cyclocybe aegerita]|uniref:Amidohydrolase-related domain-containing protein n=1 Tax=Cyclocybe aegerita TaxID=1973307 RepID=A0A8S0WV39_CYCAE|nr:unnamed protein product [Cyclocybe aegerita]
MAGKTKLPPPTTLRKAKPRLTLRQLLSYLVLLSAAATLSITLLADPADEWQDNIWPLRPPTPWDISTDYAYPRKLEYDVQEGTWLRLDVHPTSGDIVFDMVGDLYCLPRSRVSAGSLVKAHPILLGVPYDSDPHFSPTGDRIVFRSDAELGVENIWVLEWKGCEEMDVRSNNPALREQVLEEQLLAEGVPETAQRKYNRLVREGRFGAQRVTNETYRWVSDARFHPSGSKVIATKWYTSSRSLGAGEGWEYSVPSLEDIRKQKPPRIEVGSGKRVVSRSLPLGWTSERYGDQQIGPEQLIWHGGDSIIYAKNIRDPNQFTYSKDVHRGIYAIFEKNTTTGTTETLVGAAPGGASRPELSRDQRTLAFVRRVRDKEALVLKDLETGSIHHVWHGLTYDLTTVSAPMGTYPSFAFSPDDSAVIIWAAGQIYSVPLTVNTKGERVAAADPPRPIRFTAHIETRLAETRRGGVDLVAYETKDTQKVTAFKGLRVDDTGKKAVFEAGGLSYWQGVGKKGPATKVPVTDDGAPYFSPSFVHGEDDIVIHVRWSDTTYSQFELANITSGQAYKVAGAPLGRYFSPVLSETPGRKRKIAYVKSGGEYLSGDILATANPGLYVGDITLPSDKDEELKVSNIRFVPSEIDIGGRVNLRFVGNDKTLLVQQSGRAFIIDLEGETDIAGKPPHSTVASGRMSSELVVAPELRNGNVSADNIAFVDFFHVYLAPGDRVKEGESVWSRPANATEGLVRLSQDGGHDITWSGDGKKLFWFLGPYLRSLEISKLKQCSSEIEKDHLTFGISCVKTLLQYEQIDVEHSTDIARLKKDAKRAAKTHKDWPNVESDNSDVVVIINATLLTMESGNFEDDFVKGGVMVVRGGVIDLVSRSNDNFVAPSGAAVINAGGGFVIPGFIDVHAHWDGFSERFPAKSWEMEAFLAYGVTTLHNPSADNVDGFVERSRVERGQMIGPRIFTVGDIIYGAGIPGVHQDIVDMDEAKSALTRIKAEGGTASISYKNYNIPSRASRQRLLKVAQNISMICVPEGGMNWDWDLTYIIDGMTTVEHALPVPILYEDVITLYALSGTGATPTHLVNYGGAWAEQLVWAIHDVPNDEKLRRFERHDVLLALTESTARPDHSYAFYNTSASVAAMVQKGLLANIGAHGEPPIGMNYHGEMAFTGAGGLSNYEVIRAATSSGAKTLGMFPSLGSLSRGKLADFIIYPPEIDLLEGVIATKTSKLLFVARGGRIWDANTMVELWPVRGRKQVMPVINAE